MNSNKNKQKTHGKRVAVFARLWQCSIQQNCLACIYISSSIKPALSESIEQSRCGHTADIRRPASADHDDLSISSCRCDSPLYASCPKSIQKRSHRILRVNCNALVFAMYASQVGTNVSARRYISTASNAGRSQFQGSMVSSQSRASRTEHN